jgi:hypothetical protein
VRELDKEIRAIGEENEAVGRVQELHAYSLDYEKGFIIVTPVGS